MARSDMKDRNTDALDRAIARSLERAGIEVARLPQPWGNPASQLRGRLGPIEFARALSGWSASGPLPLAVARALYKASGRGDLKRASAAESISHHPRTLGCLVYGCRRARVSGPPAGPIPRGV